MSRRATTALWTGALGAIIALAGAVMVMRLFVWPYGPGSDSIAIWTLKARMLVHGGDVFHPELLHGRYPLLLPALTAGLWWLLGTDGPLGPQLLAVAFTATIVVGLVTVIAALRSWATATWAGMSLFLFPTFLAAATSEIADVPLAAFALIGLGFLALAAESATWRGSGLVLAGICLGLATLTKVEGQLVALAVAAGTGVATAIQFGPYAAMRCLGWLLVGAAPGLAALVWLSAQYTVPSEYVQASNILWAKALTWERHRLILAACWSLLSTQPALLLPVLFPILAGGVRAAWRQPAIAGSVIALATWIAGDYFVYLTTPYPLDWQLATSMERLAVQMWPSWLLIIFLATRVTNSHERQG